MPAKIRLNMPAKIRLTHVSIITRVYTSQQR